MTAKRKLLSIVVLGLCMRATAILAGEDPGDGQLVTPQPGERLLPLNYAAELVADGATIYQNDHGTSAVNGVTFSPTIPAPRRPDWGEQITVVPNPPAALEIRSIEFAVQLTGNTRLVTQFDIWDTYNTAASPVNSGLLRSDEADYGNRLANIAGYYYPAVFPFSTPVPLADADVFIEFKHKTSTGAGAPLNAFASPVADVFSGGPNIGMSPNDVYVDQNADGIFTFSAPSAGDRRRVSNTTLCGPSDCQTNWKFLIRGAPGSDLVIQPGMDLFQTPGCGTSFYNEPIDAGFFDFDEGGESCVPAASTCVPSGPPNINLCSLAYGGGIGLLGQPLVTNPSGALSPADTIVSRLGAAFLPTPGSSTTIDIEIVALSLVSASPITVTYSGGGTSQWNVEVCLSEFPQDQGTMTVTRGSCPGEGGTYSSSLPVWPKLIFTQVNPIFPCTGTKKLDFFVKGTPWLFQTTLGHWLDGAPASMGIVEEPFPGGRLDADCNGQLDPNGLPTTTSFHPGLRAPRCAGDLTCTAIGPPIMRLTAGSGGALVAHGTLPAALPQPDTDGDCYADIADNCPSLANPLQQDADDDTVGDACDNCPSACDPTQANSDGDLFGDACDCAPLVPTPGEVQGLAIASNKSTFSWTATPNAARYDVVRGLISALPLGPGGGDETCTGDIPGPYVDSTVPVVGQGRFYVVRAENACPPGGTGGTGTWGVGRRYPGAVVIPRATTTCP